jgi:hypothetical protein
MPANKGTGSSASGSEVEIHTHDGQVVNRDTLQAFHTDMRERARFIGEDRADEVMMQQALSILAAAATADTDAIMRADMGGTVQCRDAGTLEVEILSMDPVISTREDITGGNGYYITMACTVLGGEEDMLTKLGLQIGGDVVLQTGAELFVLKVAALEKSGALPYRGRVVSIPTRSGNTVVKLGAIPRRAQ